MLAPTLKDPSDFLNKLVREAGRSFDDGDHPTTHVADHLYNFCVTSIALRDCIFETRHVDNRARDAFHQEWNSNPARVACNEIANTMKHTTLRTPEGELKEIKTKGAALGTVGSVAAHMDDSGGISLGVQFHPTVMVHLSDGTTIHAFDLTDRVIDFWRDYFSAHDLPYTEQAEAQP